MIKLLIINLIVFTFLIIVASTDLKVQYIPDDAFYYLTLSRNYASLNYWTFDSGISKTSGFHLIFAYLLSAIFKLLQPTSPGFVISGILLSFFSTFIAILIGASLAFKQKNELFLMLFALVIGSQNFIYNAVSITEWSLTLLSALLYCIYYFRYTGQSLHFWNLLILFALGCMGSLSRTDFGLLPFSIAFAAFFLYALKIIPQKHVFFSIIGLFGAIAGVIIGFSHNYLFTMEFLQSSAKMKAYWAEVIGPDYFSVFSLLLDVLGVVGFVVILFIIIKLSALLLYKFRTQYNQSINTFLSTYFLKIHDYPEPRQLLMAVASAVCLIGYSIFYSHNGATQAWYSANIIVPILLFFYGTSNFILPRLGEKSRVFLTLLLLGISIQRIVNTYPIAPNHAPWPHQVVMLNAGNYLNENEDALSKGQIGAWNAGIIGYYQGGRVINLDGLVNNDIYPFAVENDLLSYLTEQNIVYIIDFERMFTIELRRIRGGYNDPEFLDKLYPITFFDDINEETKWKRMTLYQITDYPNPPDS